MENRNLKKRYRSTDGKKCIEVRIRNPLQLFDARDPAPFRERDLDDDFVHYIIAASMEIPKKIPLKLVIHLEDHGNPDFSDETLIQAIRNDLSYRTEILQSELRTFLKQAQLFLLIGLSMLGICLTVAQKLKNESPVGVLAVIEEGLIIFGWVSIWKPIELILFDWYPLYERIQRYKRLSRVEINLKKIQPSKNLLPQS